MRVTNGYGLEIEAQHFADNLFAYRTFDEAATLINDRWTRHHIHKEIKGNRVYKSAIIVVEDAEMYSTHVSDGKKFFIHIDEIKRLRDDYAGRTKRTVVRCQWCGRPRQSCKRKPCQERIRETTDYTKDVETIAEFWNRFLTVNQDAREATERINRAKEERRRRDSERKSVERDNEEDGGRSATSQRDSADGEG